MFISLLPFTPSPAAQHSFAKMIIACVAHQIHFSPPSAEIIGFLFVFGSRFLFFFLPIFTLFSHF